MELQQEQQTMLMSLYLHAQDAESSSPILGDRFAAGVLAQVDVDLKAMKRLKGNLPVIAARAKLIDEKVREFLAATPDAVVLHLGCGLDSRVLRIDPGPDVTWIEVDQGPVIELRERLYPARAGVRTVAASVTDAAWWADVPAGRPWLIVCEGLLMYLPPSAIAAVLDHACRETGSAKTIVADSVAGWVRKVASWQPNMRAASTGFQSSTEDLQAAVARHPELVAAGTASLVTAAREATSGAMSAFLKAFDLVPGGHRAMCLHTFVFR